jgi:hypothetical protein
LRFEPGFCGTIEKNHGEREPEPAESCGKIHAVKEAKNVGLGAS